MDDIAQLANWVCLLLCVVGVGLILKRELTAAQAAAPATRADRAKRTKRRWGGRSFRAAVPGLLPNSAPLGFPAPPPGYLAPSPENSGQARPYDALLEVIRQEQGEWYIMYFIEKELSKILQHNLKHSRKEGLVGQTWDGEESSSDSESEGEGEESVSDYTSGGEESGSDSESGEGSDTDFEGAEDPDEDFTSEGESTESSGESGEDSGEDFTSGGESGEDSGEDFTSGGESGEDSGGGRAGKSKRDAPARTPAHRPRRGPSSARARAVRQRAPAKNAAAGGLAAAPAAVAVTPPSRAEPCVRSQSAEVVPPEEGFPGEGSPRGR